MDACTKIPVNYFTVNVRYFGENCESANAGSYRREKWTCEWHFTKARVGCSKTAVLNLFGL